MSGSIQFRLRTWWLIVTFVALSVALPPISTALPQFWHLSLVIVCGIVALLGCVVVACMPLALVAIDQTVSRDGKRNAFLICFKISLIGALLTLPFISFLVGNEIPAEPLPPPDFSVSGNPNSQ